MDWTLNPLAWFPSHTLRRCQTLSAGVPLRLTHARGRRIVCRQGCVWVTAAGWPEDIFLSAGDRWTIPGNGLVLVEAEGSAMVDVGC